MHKKHVIFTKPTPFRYFAPHAHRVSLVVRPAKDGHFTTHPMHKTVDGWWQSMLELQRGRYVYHLVVDGQRTLDPTSLGSVSDEHGLANSIREVGH